MQQQLWPRLRCYPEIKNKFVSPASSFYARVGPNIPTSEDPQRTESANIILTATQMFILHCSDSCSYDSLVAIWQLLLLQQQFISHEQQMKCCRRPRWQAAALPQSGPALVTNQQLFCAAAAGISKVRPGRKGAACKKMEKLSHVQYLLFYYFFSMWFLFLFCDVRCF